MINKRLLVTCALTLSMMGVASAKSYSVTLTSTEKVGTTELKPGDYSVKIEGSQAIFTGEENSKSVTVPVKIEHRDKKFDQTSVETINQSGVESIKSISLGG